MYKVIKYFTDNQDKGYAYNVGDSFPRKGLTVSDKRLAELSSNKNKQGVPLIMLNPTATPLKETPSEVSPAPEEVLDDKQTGESPIETPKAKEKPRRGRKKTDAKPNS